MPENIPTSGHMTPADEAAYRALAADPKSTASDLQSFVAQRGLQLTNEAAADFIASRAQPGARVGGPVSYEVQAPNGATYEVEAPAGTTEAEVLAKVKANIGSMIDQGAAESEIDTYLQSEGLNTTDLGGTSQPPRANASFLQSLSATAGETLDGVIPGAGRFMAGAGSVVGNGIAAGLGRSEFNPSAAFADGQASSDADKAQLEADHPNVATGAQFAGLAGSFALPVARVAKGAGMAAHTVNGALSGAGFGALSGALNDTGDGRLTNAALGASVGGVLGAAAAPIANKVGQTISTTRRNIPGVNAALTGLENIPNRLRGLPLTPPSANAHAQAERTLAREMEGSTIQTGMGTGDVQATPANVATELDRRHALGVPAMAADVTPVTRAAGTWAAEGTGPMATRARAAMATRQAQAASRAREHIAADLGPAVDPIAEVEAIKHRAATASAPGYAQAYAQPMVITPEIEGIMQTPAFQSALPQAAANIRNGMGDPQALGFRMDGDGNLSGIDTLSTEGFDQVIRAMKDAGRTAGEINPITGRVTNNTNSIHINNRARDLQTELGNQNGVYRDTVANYADEMALTDGMRRGADVAKLSGPEIAAQMRTMPQHAQEAWTAGARTVLADSATTTGLNPGADVSQRIRQDLGLSGAGLHAADGDTAKLQAIEAMSGRPGALSRLDDRLEAEGQAYQTFAGTGGARQPGGDQGASGALGTAVEIGRKVATGNTIGALSTALLRGNPRGTASYRGDVQERMAELLTASTPRGSRAAMDALADRSVIDRTNLGVLSTRANRMALVGALQFTGQNADPSPMDEYE